MHVERDEADLDARAPRRPLARLHVAVIVALDLAAPPEGRQLRGPPDERVHTWEWGKVQMGSRSIFPARSGDFLLFFLSFNESIQFSS